MSSLVFRPPSIDDAEKTDPSSHAAKLPACRLHAALHRSDLQCGHGGDRRPASRPGLGTTPGFNDIVTARTGSKAVLEKKAHVLDSN